MKIGINLLPFRKNLTGTGVYAYGIIDELQKLDLENEYLLFTNRESNHVFDVAFKNCKKIVFPFYAQNTIVRIFWEQFIFPFYLSKYGVDLLFSPSVVLPVFSKCKNIVCIHDLIPFHGYKKYTKLRSLYIKIMTKISAQKANRILTVSNNSKKEIEQFCNVSQNKIAVTYGGINRAILKLNKKKWEQFKTNNIIPDHYILYVGTLEPGKNIDTLIAAYNYLKIKYKISEKLVIAGGKGWLFQSIFNSVKKLKIEKDVIFPEYVPDNVLGCLYKNADAFILPSSYEGLGRPVIEAMHFGTPVIVSNISSLPEVVGQAGKLIDPHNEHDIAEAIYEILENPSLRENMINNGFEQASKFSWKQAAQVVLTEFEMPGEN